LNPIARSPSDQRWLSFGYALIAAMFVFRLAYLASGTIELSNDEGYQWLWSKHLALSYYSKPPGIAFIQFAGTSLWGDTQFGVRFFSPVFAALLSIVMLRFMAKVSSARLGVLLLLIITSAPLMSVGTILMTIDPPLVLCWTMSMLAGWRAVQPDGKTSQWLLAGLAAGLAFLCKYSAAYLIVCWSVFFLLFPPARPHLRRPGPWLALLILALATLPVILWNSQHDWITFHHVAGNAGMNSPWEPTWKTLSKNFFPFLYTQAALLNPVFLIAAIWAMIAFWKRRRENPLLLYLFCMGGLVFLGHLAWSLHSRILPNWVAPSVVPMYALMVLYWDARWRDGVRLIKRSLITGLVLGLVIVVPMHQTDLIRNIAGQKLPGDMDPLRRVRGYRATAEYVEAARERLQQEGKPAFIIGSHYGLTGLITFYLPEARTKLNPKPLVYCRSSNRPENQFYFWPEYAYPEHCQGENAIYVMEPGTARLEKNWPWKWLIGREVRVAQEPRPASAPETLLGQFESVTDLGVHEVKLGDRIYKRIQLFECRNLR
jgi:4-amino-4-deoxy-L-arabinose transferase-like glycosyltransferase